MSPKTNALADGLIQRSSFTLDEAAPKTVPQDKEGNR